ncbi:hypothetical protein NM208_g5214 [Fusarium decemcellulare]|uniref:Uncharacterized protein n=1 Tax=Fusarium decemcellulare TaxID=57161 RepID=A0ACC1SHY2_9HYPO|nr:hypothetical protein NM208_g5214 [Fusarium decemcellulare]
MSWLGTSPDCSKAAPPTPLVGFVRYEMPECMHGPLVIPLPPVKVVDLRSPTCTPNARNMPDHFFNDPPVNPRTWLPGYQTNGDEEIVAGSCLCFHRKVTFGFSKKDILLLLPSSSFSEEFFVDFLPTDTTRGDSVYTSFSRRSCQKHRHRLLLSAIAFPFTIHFPRSEKRSFLQQDIDNRIQTFHHPLHFASLHFSSSVSCSTAPTLFSIYGRLFYKSLDENPTFTDFLRRFSPPGNPVKSLSLRFESLSTEGFVAVSFYCFSTASSSCLTVLFLHSATALALESNTNIAILVARQWAQGGYFFRRCLCGLARFFFSSSSPHGEAEAEPLQHALLPGRDDDWRLPNQAVAGIAARNDELIPGQQQGIIPNPQPADHRLVGRNEPDRERPGEFNLPLRRRVRSPPRDPGPARHQEQPFAGRFAEINNLLDEQWVPPEAGFVPRGLMVRIQVLGRANNMLLRDTIVQTRRARRTGGQREIRDAEEELRWREDRWIEIGSLLDELRQIVPVGAESTSDWNSVNKKLLAANLLYQDEGLVKGDEVLRHGAWDSGSGILTDAGTVDYLGSKEIVAAVDAALDELDVAHGCVV